jgi:transcriptional regulator GlxA family with amidase domain
MKIAVVTFDGFNEIDSFVAAHILNRVERAGWKAEITAPAEFVTSLNGVRVAAQQPLEFTSDADAVLLGSGRRTAQVIEDAAVMSRIKVDPRRQLIASQCSGALILARLGLLDGAPACTDLKTRPAVEAAGVRVLDRPFYARGNVASAGGCLSGQYLATWMIWRLIGKEAAIDALSYVAPVGQEEEYVSRAVAAVSEFIAEERLSEATAV